MLNAEQTLEFNKVKENLRTFAQTELGQNRIDDLQVLTIEKQIKYRLNESNEALTIIKALDRPPLGGASDVSGLIKRTEIGSVLTAEELLAIKNLLMTVSDLRAFKEQLIEADLKTPLFDKQFEQVATLKPLQQAINKCIDETGKVLDSASPELGGIRRGIQKAHGTARARMSELLNKQKDKLTEPLITLRNGRLTLPVKAEYKNTLKGTIHDQSSTGHTTYIEPAEVVELSNKLQTLLVEEKAEIHRILRGLTQQVATYATDLYINRDVLSQLDFMFAKGGYAKHLHATMPRIITSGGLTLIEARHPLIDKEKVIANDIVLAGNTKAMVITGPNTGGKTVTLKTVGLLAMMMQSGLLIPAHASSEMMIFDQIFADIGDEQSIEQSLSTFSSHMTNIVSITKRLTQNSLVLFDELGAGTDPLEGASLAIAILDYVKTRSKLTVATSHYSELKAYAYEANDVMNASVEFDVETLSPTYRLLLGVPGRSNAFEISKKLGLMDQILKQAEAGNAKNQTEVSELIRKIEDKGAELDNLLQETQLQNKTALALKKEYEEKLAKFEMKAEKEMTRAREEGEHAVKVARETAEDIVRQLREIKKNDQIKDHELTEKLAILNETEAQHREKFKKTANNTKPLKPGDDVMILSLARQGELIKQNRNGEWTVAIGVMSMNLKEADLQYMKPAGKPKKKNRNVRGGSMSVKGATNVRASLDLHGLRYEEAMHVLDQYFDQALLANYETITIVHGFGTGALRKGVHKYLKGNRYVKDYRFGGEAEGGMGATVVTLK